MLSCEFGSTHSGTRQTRAPIRADERGAAQEHSVRAAPGPAQLISAARSRQPGLSPQRKLPLARRYHRQTQEKLPSKRWQLPSASRQQGCISRC